VFTIYVWSQYICVLETQSIVHEKRFTDGAAVHRLAVNNNSTTTLGLNIDTRSLDVNVYSLARAHVAFSRIRSVSH